MSETETYEQSGDHASASEIEVQRRPHKGGKGGHHVREELTPLTYLQACPLAVTCFRHQSCYEFCERPCLSGSMHTWRGCWLRPTKIKNCWGTWRTIIGHGCTCARQKWRCFKGGWPRHYNGERGLIPSISWPRLHWRTKALNSLATAQIPRNFEHFG